MIHRLIVKYKECLTHLLPALMLIFASLTVYGSILSHDFLSNWDDNRYILENPDVLGISWPRIQAVFSKYYVGNYAPVQLLSYMLDHVIWGLWAGGFLLTNLLLHILNGLLLYRLLFRLVKSRLAAWCGAAFFMMHPVQVETVAWISQRKNLLAMLFFLIAWEFYLAYRDEGTAKRRIYYLTSLLALLLALLSKSVAVIFPVVIFLFDYFYTSAPARIRYVDKVPYLLVAIVAAVLALLSQTPDYTEWGAGGGRAGFHGGSAIATFFTMLPVFCSYLRMIVWPTGLSALYEPAIHNSFDFSVLTAALILGGITFLLYRICSYDRRLAFWPLFTIVAILPVSQIVPLVTLMNDRYLYFPMIGVAALTAYAIKFINQFSNKWIHVFTLSVIATLLLLLSGASMQRSKVWRNAATLWSDTVKKTPDSYLAWEGMGESLQYAATPRRGEAIVAYQRAIKLNPSGEMSRYNLGMAYIELFDYANADTILRELLKRSPNNVMGWTAFGDLALHRFEYSDAESRYRKALSLQPEAVQVHQKIGNLMVLLGRIDDARSSYQRIEGIQWSNNALNAYELARVEAIAGNTGASIVWLESALQRGYSNYAGIMADEELMPMMPDARFADLVNKYFPQQR